MNMIDESKIVTYNESSKQFKIQKQRLSKEIRKFEDKETFIFAQVYIYIYIYIHIFINKHLQEF